MQADLSWVAWLPSVSRAGAQPQAEARAPSLPCKQGTAHSQSWAALAHQTPNPGVAGTLQPPCRGEWQDRAWRFLEDRAMSRFHHLGGCPPPSYFYQTVPTRRAQRDLTKPKGKPQCAPCPCHGPQSAWLPMPIYQNLEVGGPCRPLPCSPGFRTSTSLLSSSSHTSILPGAQPIGTTRGCPSSWGVLGSLPTPPIPPLGSGIQTPMTVSSRSSWHTRFLIPAQITEPPTQPPVCPAPSGPSLLCLPRPGAPPQSPAELTHACPFPEARRHPAMPAQTSAGTLRYAHARTGQ